MRGKMGRVYWRLTLFRIKPASFWSLLHLIVFSSHLRMTSKCPRLSTLDLWLPAGIPVQKKKAKVWVPETSTLKQANLLLVWATPSSALNFQLGLESVMSLNCSCLWGAKLLNFSRSLFPQLQNDAMIPPPLLIALSVKICVCLMFARVPVVVIFFSFVCKPSGSFYSPSRKGCPLKT